MQHCYWLCTSNFSIISCLNLQVKLRNDMPDDMLKDAIETSRRVLQGIDDFETQGMKSE